MAGTSVPLLVALLVGLAITTFLSAAAVLSFHAFRHGTERMARVNASLLAEQAALALAGPIWNLDSAQIRASLRGLAREDGVEKIVLHLSGAGAIVETGGTTTSKSDWAVETRPVVYAETKLGDVEVHLGRGAVDAYLGRIRNAAIAIVVVLSVTLGGSLYLLLWWAVLRPLRTLDRLARGVRDSSVVPEARSSRFLGELETLRQNTIEALDLLERRLESLREETRYARESERRFRVLVDTIPDLIWLKDRGGVYLACNRMFERFFGASESEIRGRRDHDFVAAEQADFFRKMDLDVLEAGHPIANEETVVFADDGHVAHLETIKAPVVDEEGNLVGVLGVGRDITQRRKDEAERRKIDEKIAGMQKLEALGVLVAGVAHNINNVLSAILGNASLQRLTTSDASDREAFANIEKACQRGSDVVQSLIRFARPHLKVESPFEIHHLLGDVRPLLHGTMRNRAVLEEDLLADPLWVMGDGADMNQAFLNLFINALDALPERGGTIRVSTTDSDETTVRVRFEDDGCGMPPEVLARVLEPFYTTKPPGKGTGLGLSMTLGVVKAHGGELHLESEPGKGTRVTISLPRIAAPREKGATGESSEPSQALRVLVVDDDPDLVFLTKRMLTMGGHSVATAASGEEGLEVMGREGPFDAVVVDQNMPGMSGTQFIGHVLEIHPQTAVIVSSGQPEIEGLPALRGKRVEFVPKPCSAEDFLSALRRLGRSRPSDG